MTTHADQHAVARAAAKEVFFIMGVDVDDAKQVEAFRRDIRFAGDLRRQMAKGMGAVLVTLMGAAAAYLWAHFTFKGH